MFERFTERARHVVVLAQEEARSDALRHNYIGTEHILLGLLRESDGSAAGALASLGVTLGEVRRRVIGIVGRGDELVPGQIPFTPRAKRTLELAMRAALALGDYDIGTEHLLLGLVGERDGVGPRVLLDVGVGADAVRDELLRLRADAPPD